MQEAELLDSVAGGELQIQDDRSRRRSTDQRLELVLANKCVHSPPAAYSYAREEFRDGLIVIHYNELHEYEAPTPGLVARAHWAGGRLKSRDLYKPDQGVQIAGAERLHINCIRPQHRNSGCRQYSQACLVLRKLQVLAE